MGADWLLERTVDTGMNGVSFAPQSLSDLDFTDDVALLADSTHLLVNHDHIRHIQWATLQHTNKYRELLTE